MHLLVSAPDRSGTETMHSIALPCFSKVVSLGTERDLWCGKCGFSGTTAISSVLTVLRVLGRGLGEWVLVWGKMGEREGGGRGEGERGKGEREEEERKWKERDRRVRGRGEGGDGGGE